MRDDLYHEILGAEDEGVVLTDVGRVYMRDRFAMNASNGMLSGGDVDLNTLDTDEGVSEFARISYRVASAMLAERERVK